MPKKSKKPKKTKTKSKKPKAKSVKVIPAVAGAGSRGVQQTIVVAPTGARGKYKKRRTPEEIAEERKRTARQVLGIPEERRIQLTGQASLGRRQPTQTRVQQPVGGFTGLTEGYGITQNADQKLDKKLREMESRLLTQIKQENKSVDGAETDKDKPRTSELVEGFLQQQRTAQIEAQQRQEQLQRELVLRESQARARARNRNYRNQYLPTFQTDAQLQRDNEIIRERRQRALREAEKEEEKLLQQISTQQQERADVLQERVSRLNEADNRRKRQLTLQESKARGRRLFLEEQKRLQEQNEKEIRQREIMKREKELEKQQRERIKRTQEAEKKQREKIKQQLKKDDEDDKLFVDPITEVDIQFQKDLLEPQPRQPPQPTADPTLPKESEVRPAEKLTSKETEIRPAEIVKEEEVRPVETAELPPEPTLLEQALETQDEIDDLVQQLRVAVDEEEVERQRLIADLPTDDEDFVAEEEFVEIEQPQDRPLPSREPPALPPRDPVPALPPRNQPHKKQSLTKSTSTSTETSTRGQQTGINPQAFVEIQRLRDMIEESPDIPDVADAPAQMPDKAFQIATEKATQEERKRKQLQRQQRQREAMGRERAKRDKQKREHLQKSVDVAESFVDELVSRSILQTEVAKSGGGRRGGQGRKVADVEVEIRKYRERTGQEPDSGLILAFSDKENLQRRKAELTNLLLGFGVNGDYIPFNARKFNKITNQANDRDLLNQLRSLLERDRRDFVRDNAREIMENANELIDVKNKIKVNQNAIQKLLKRR
tara:strand:+ start:1133 stop:3457 length:2325 start_codon:yes stop_codon:yes gene_type:complete